MYLRIILRVGKLNCCNCTIVFMDNMLNKTNSHFTQRALKVTVDVPNCRRWSFKGKPHQCNLQSSSRCGGGTSESKLGHLAWQRWKRKLSSKAAVPLTGPQGSHSRSQHSHPLFISTQQNRDMKRLSALTEPTGRSRLSLCYQKISFENNFFNKWKTSPLTDLWWDLTFQAEPQEKQKDEAEACEGREARSLGAWAPTLAEAAWTSQRLAGLFFSKTVYYSIPPSVNHTALRAERWLGLPQINPEEQLTTGAGQQWKHTPQYGGSFTTEPWVNTILISTD